MSDAIDIKITSMSLSRTMISEIKDPSIFDYIYVSFMSSIISICFHLSLKFFFEHVLTFVIHFIINVLFNCGKILYTICIVLWQVICYLGNRLNPFKKYKKYKKSKHINKMRSMRKIMR
jgi:hypothetical protein